TRKKEEFIPQVEGEYKIYVCGPTVYNFVHIGNARPAVIFDTMRRYLEYRGNKVNYVSNITDIDDKIIKKANEDGTTFEAVARKYEEEYYTDLKGLNVKPATARPRVSDTIPEIIDIVQTLIDKGHAYRVDNGDVYFRVHSFNEYGKLSHNPLEELESGARIAVDDIKESPADFALWKASKPGEPKWDSPFSEGRPGWHIECSAMSKKHLGDKIDLHCGGEDLIFPHHENEIAQSECANGCEFSHYWMHNAFLNVDNQKMSKSLNNFFTVREIAEQVGYEVIRYFLLTAHYRSPLNFTREIIDQCKSSLERLYTAREHLDFLISHAADGKDEIVAEADRLVAEFVAVMDDDLNTADALSKLFELVTFINVNGKEQSKAALEHAAKAFDEMAEVLGILYNRNKDEIPAEVKALVEERTAVRKEKNWARADQIRDELAAMGYEVKDTPQGPQIIKK
ncbi:MAG: cysteine--tRNA ligase, partial [Oscillospiraceae bacterium]|nr:cysteine--tRNA ligase [Oscillospiraceae bacterium]